jgi:polar amino acid transport system substrate-binding protein
MLKLICVEMDLKQSQQSIISYFRLARFFLIFLDCCLAIIAHADDLTTPLFWNLQHHVEKPNLGNLRVVRFVTDDTYPPFGFTQADGSLAGFNIDLARAICDELQLACTIQVRRWDALIPAVEQGQADAIIASQRITAGQGARVDFSSPYYKTPARFMVRTSSPFNDITPETMSGMTIAVERHSAHEAYLRHYFAHASIKTYDDATSLRAALKRGDVDIAFGDGVSQAIWLAGQDSNHCCRFASGPYLEDHYFGEGAGIAVRKGNLQLRRAIDYALAHIASKGLYRDLYLRYFPISFF